MHSMCPCMHGSIAVGVAQELQSEAPCARTSLAALESVRSSADSTRGAIVCGALASGAAAAATVTAAALDRNESGSLPCTQQTGS